MSIPKRVVGKKVRDLRNLSSSHKNQIHVLTALFKDDLASKSNAKDMGNEGMGTEQRRYEISEIAQAVGINDEKEVQRYLLILEGQKLVAPYPEGDFTSNRWSITRAGVKAVRTISKSVLQ